MVKRRKSLRVLAITAIIIFIIVLCLFVVSYIHQTIPKENIVLEISNVSVSDFNESYITAESTLGYNLPSGISENMKNYKVINLNYYVDNNSDQVEMQDVRCHPAFTGELKPMVSTYNSGNGTYYLFIEPMLSSGFVQHIILHSGDMTSDEIYQLFMNETIELTYYTNGFSGSLYTNTGHGWKGLGKHKLKFIVKEVLKTG